MEKAEKIVILIAISLLTIGAISNAIIQKKEVSSYIEINGRKIDTNEIFSICIEKEIIIRNETYYGVSLACVINLTNVGNPENYSYRIIASDGYQKTVLWEDIEKGILTKEKRTIFPHLSKAFWINDVIKIEVIE